MIFQIKDTDYMSEMSNMLRECDYAEEYAIFFAPSVVILVHKHDDTWRMRLFRRTDSNYLRVGMFCDCPVPLNILATVKLL